MRTAVILISLMLAALLTYSAVLKFSHRSDVVARYARVGVREAQLNLLASILLIGVLGILAGIAWTPAGLAAAAGLVLYFGFAIGAHVRFGDTGNLAVPVVLEVMALSLFYLRIVE